ncbi:MAG: hypothetical protein JO159_00005, partial [Acidobacteria bacterium]|nr:hypothetical protein [Acidobacteriota bacterium]
MRRFFGFYLLAFAAVWLLSANGATAQRTDSQQSSQTQADQATGNDQENKSHDQMHHDMPGMNGQDSSMQGMDMSGEETHAQPRSLIDALQQYSASGTDIEPISTPASMLMSMKGNWMLMLHGVAFLSDIQQTGPRGADKFLSTNWIMPMAQRKFGRGTLTLRTMLSLEPATVTDRLYPELFQQGETAYGKPIVDGQHPHNFFMELAALYDISLGERTLLSFYVAPVGDPAIGPPAYPHRVSASEDPIAPLSHHLQDSTHIADEVVTIGITHGIARIEASGFHGREPGENRWTVETGNIDSWSTRLTVNPGRNWSAQYSFAHLNSPEALQPDENIDRMTASVMYNRPLANGNWASLLVWGRNKNQPSGLVWNSYLAESTVRFAGSNNIWGRFENVD